MSEIRPIDKAIEILGRTNDGNDLSPTHLTLMEYAANGFLNEKGLEKLDEIYQQVMSSEYKKPYLQGVEFMTNDHEGYIYFKDREVEHFSSFYMYSPEAKDYLIELQDKYLFMERNGLEGKSVYDEDFLKMYSAEKIDKLNTLMNGSAIIFSRIRSNGASTAEYLLPGKANEDDVWNSIYQKEFVKRYDYIRVFNTSIEHLKFGSGDERPATADELRVLNCNFDYMKKNNYFESLGKTEFEKMNNLPEVETEDAEDDEEMEM